MCGSLPASSRAVTGAVIQRVIAKIAAAWNPADKFWRSGDILGAIGIATSLITRVVLGRSRCERDASARLPVTAAGSRKHLLTSRLHPPSKACAVG
jgi:hypothetical protein